MKSWLDLLWLLQNVNNLELSHALNWNSLTGLHISSIWLLITVKSVVDCVRCDKLIDLASRKVVFNSVIANVRCADIAFNGTLQWLVEYRWIVEALILGHTEIYIGTFLCVGAFVGSTKWHNERSYFIGWKETFEGYRFVHNIKSW